MARRANAKRSKEAPQADEPVKPDEQPQAEAEKTPRADEPRGVVYIVNGKRVDPNGVPVKE